MSMNLTEKETSPFEAVVKLVEALLPYKPSGTVLHEIRGIYFGEDEHWPRKISQYIDGQKTLPRRHDSQFDAIIELVKKFFPTGYNSETEDKVKGIFFGTGYGEWPAELYDFLMQNGTFVHPAKEKIVAEALTQLVTAIFPGVAPESVKSDVQMYITTEGISNYHSGLGEYIVNNIRRHASVTEMLTFQELTEVLSILPGRAPKELGVKLYRDDNGDLKLQFVGEIDVRATAGKRPE